MAKPPLKGWACDGCSSFWSYVHFGNNPYADLDLREGAPCPTDWVIKKCNGVLHEVYLNEDLTEPVD